jgi:hypothetical protein
LWFDGAGSRIAALMLLLAALVLATAVGQRAPQPVSTERMGTRKAITRFPPRFCFVIDRTPQNPAQ